MLRESRVAFDYDGETGTLAYFESQSCDDPGSGVASCHDPLPGNFVALRHGVGESTAEFTECGGGHECWPSSDLSINYRGKNSATSPRPATPTLDLQFRFDWTGSELWAGAYGDNFPSVEMYADYGGGNVHRIYYDDASQRNPTSDLTITDRGLENGVSGTVTPKGVG